MRFGFERAFPKNRVLLADGSPCAEVHYIYAKKPNTDNPPEMSSGGWRLVVGRGAGGCKVNICTRQTVLYNTHHNNNIIILMLNNDLR